MPVTFFDSHAHLTMSPLWENIDTIAHKAKEANISHIINICTNAEELERALLLEKRYDWILPTAATTPHDVETLGEKDFAFFEKMDPFG